MSVDNKITGYAKFNDFFRLYLFFREIFAGRVNFIIVRRDLTNFSTVQKSRKNYKQKKSSNRIVKIT